MCVAARFASTRPPLTRPCPLRYWSHRALHVVPYLWNVIHSIHHYAKTPLSRVTYQDHWADNFGNAIVGQTFAQILIPMDLPTFVFSRIFRVAESLEKHSGHSSGWNLAHAVQFRWMPFAQMPHHHDWHHEGFKSCNCTCKSESASERRAQARSAECSFRTCNSRLSFSRRKRPAQNKQFARSSRRTTARCAWTAASELAIARLARSRANGEFESLSFSMARSQDVFVWHPPHLPCSRSLLPLFTHVYVVTDTLSLLDTFSSLGGVWDWVFGTRRAGRAGTVHKAGEKGGEEEPASMWRTREDKILNAGEKQKVVKSVMDHPATVVLPDLVIGAFAAYKLWSCGGSVCY